MVKIKTMRLKEIFIAFLVLTGCSAPNQKSNQDFRVIDVPLKGDDHQIMMSSFVNSISYIPFETKDECLIGCIDEIIVTDDFYYIVDETKACSVLCFDISGKFICKLGSRGPASGEYMQITDVNVYKDKVYLWDCSLQKLFIFDHDGHFLEEKKFDYMAESFAVLDDSWIVFYGDYKANKKYERSNLYPNLLFVNVDNGETKSDLFFDSRMCYSSIISSPFNFVSNANFVTPLSDTIYQALPSAVLKKRYVLQFGEQYQKAQRDYIEKLKTETVDVYQGIEFMKKIPYVYTFLDTPSYAFLKYNWEDYYYLGIINHKESDAYIEASGYKKMNIVNDMDDIAVFVPLATYKNTVYSYRSPERITSDEISGRHIEPDDNPIIVKMELK